MIVYNGNEKHTIEAGENRTVLEALQEHGLTLSAPCGGKGVCGKCAVYAEGKGRVLACREPAADDLVIRLPAEQLLQQGQIAEADRCRVFPADGDMALCAACDIGTTTVVCRLLDGKTGQTLATAGEPSAQRGFGADVLSRIHAASIHLALLHEQITGQIARMLSALCEKTERPASIGRLAVSGNTVMCHLFAGISPASIGTVPFLPTEYFGKEYDGAALGLPMCARVYVAPAAAGFVGGDITADLLAVLQGQEEKRTLLLDIGTNGEMAVTGARIDCCATAVGSAFEGAEMTMGMPAAPGAISHVTLDARRLRVEVIGGGSARGICGSGYLDAAAVLLSMGLLDENGQLRRQADVSVAYRKYLGSYGGQPCVYLTPDVCVTQEDIRDLQMAKAAFAAGLSLLLDTAQLRLSDIRRVVIAGGFGAYLKKESAAAIGLLPKELLPVTESVGNAALSGAASAALSAAARARLAQLRERMRYLELAADMRFAERYMAHMSFETA